MKHPTAEELVAVFRDLTLEKAELLCELCDATYSGDLPVLVERVPATEEYVRSLYSCPYDKPMWCRSVVLHALDTLLETYGVEAIPGGDDCSEPEAQYLNSGDTYTTTLVYDGEQDAILITTMGDFIESKETESMAL